MAPINITAQDRKYIERIVATEADHSLARTNPRAYEQQVAGIVDTVLNRVASPEYPDTIADVANQRNQFSAINGPTDRNYTVYGSVERVPDKIVPAVAKAAVNNWINQRIAGAPSSVGGNLNYANPNFSDKSNLGWIEALDGPRLGAGVSIHYHGTTAGSTPVEAVITGDFYAADGTRLPPGEVPNVVASELDTREAPVPRPLSERPMRQAPVPRPAAERPAEISAGGTGLGIAGDSADLTNVPGLDGRSRLPDLAPSLLNRPPQSFAGQEGAAEAGLVSRPQASVPTPAVPGGRFAGQERGPVSMRPSRANVPLPRPRPASPRDIASAEGRTVATIPSVTPSSVRTPPRVTAPRPVSRRPMSYAGQEAAPEAGLVQRKASSPPIGDVDHGQPTFAASERTQLVRNGPSYAAQDAARPTRVAPAPRPAADRPAASAAPAASPADIPKYITRVERFEVPQRLVGEDAIKPAGAGKTGVPLGERTYKYSRDAQERLAQGVADAKKLEPVFATRTVTTLNPDWIANTRKQPAPPAVEKPAEDYGLLGDIRQAIGLPGEGLGPGLLRALQNGLGLSGIANGPGTTLMRQPLSSQQISAAMSRPENHNPTAMQAISRGSRSYTLNGTRMPTTAMNGKVRHTYGDSGGSLVD